MLKLNQWPWKRILFVSLSIGIVIGILAAISLPIPPKAEICDKNPYTGNKECADYHIVLVLLWHIGELLNYYGGAIAALATAVVAWFTATIWAVNRANLRHAREVERAYVSGGGAREIANEIHQTTPPILPAGSVAVPQQDGTTLVLRPTGFFRIDANNHGKTRALVHDIQHGFCDAQVQPPIPIPYGALRPCYDALGPGEQSRPIDRVSIPHGQFNRIAIFARIHWRDIWGKEWSSGFIYEIPSGDARYNGSISINAPRDYWDDREED